MTWIDRLQQSTQGSKVVLQLLDKTIDLDIWQSSHRTIKCFTVLSFLDYFTSIFASFLHLNEEILLKLLLGLSTTLCLHFYLNTEISLLLEITLAQKRCIGYYVPRFCLSEATSSLFF